MVFWGIELTAKQPAATELPRRGHSTDTRLHYHYTGINELQWFACGDYHSDLLLMVAIYRWPLLSMWRHLQAATAGNRKK